MTAIRAELTGADSCTAAGLVGRGASPILTLCRQLLAAGHDPDRPVEVFRGGVLALRVKSIAEGAGLTVGDDRNGSPTFRRWNDDVGDAGASPVRRNDHNDANYTPLSTATSAGAP